MELMQLLNIENTQRNRSRIGEAIRRYNLKPPHQSYSKKVLVEIFKKYNQENGKIPTPKELDKIKELPGKGTIMRFFGSWKNFRKALG